MSSVVALIPSRAGSKRLPGKGMRLLGGKPLIVWTIDAALDSEVYDDVVVCSDDDAVLDVAHDMCSYWRRPPVPDEQTDLEWVHEALSPGSPTNWSEHDTFSILRPTSPFRDAETIRRAWDTWLKVRDDVDSLRAVRKVSEHPFKQWDEDGDPLYERIDNWTEASRHLRYQPWNQPTQRLSTFYIQTAGLEIAWSRVLAKASISGRRVAPFVLEGPEALDINSIEDWWVAERYLAEGIVK